MHKFYHADRSASLIEGQDIVLDSNNLSRFGTEYWHAINHLPVEEMTDAQLREFYLEKIRNEPIFSAYTSRMQSMFAANSIEEAAWFALAVEPIPDHPINIFEIYADRFWTLDMNWLDYKSDLNTMLSYYRKYWYSEISNHAPKEGVRRPPRLEVLIALPAKVGQVVHTVYPSSKGTGRSKAAPVL
ncbi:hypothetical protein RDG65_000924 [Vibrio fluvialis]|nr:hypothetical protein [Vibrio fluvialis]